MNEGRMSGWDLQVALTRYRELLSEAEAEQLARRAPRPKRSVFQLLRAQFGGRLITLGHRWAPEFSVNAAVKKVQDRIEQIPHLS